MRKVTIGYLTGIVAWLGVGLAGLRSPTPLMMNATFYLSVAILAVASYKARSATNPGATWWFGLALFGWLHLIMGIVVLSARNLFGIGMILPVDIVWGLLWLRLTPDDTDPTYFFGSYYVFHSVFSVVFAAAMATVVSLGLAWRRGKTKPISGSVGSSGPSDRISDPEERGRREGL